MAKAKEAPSTSPILYDARAGQKVPLSIPKNGRDYRLVHNLKPLENDRWIELQNDILLQSTRSAKVTSDIIRPQYNTWLDLVESVEGYKARDDWKEHIHINDGVAAVTAVMHTHILDNEAVEVSEDAAEYDDELPTKISFRALQSGALLTLSISYREETKAERDEYLAILTNAPNENAIASAEKLSEAEKLYRLGKKLMVGFEGYADGSQPPAWHIALTIKTFFERQTDRLGKYLPA